MNTFLTKEEIINFTKAMEEFSKISLENTNDLVSMLEENQHETFSYDTKIESIEQMLEKQLAIIKIIKD